MSEEEGTLDGAQSAGTAPERGGATWRALWQSHARTAAAGAAGAAAGAAYAYFIRCHTGTCPITSSVWSASLYGLGVGAVLGWPTRRR
jgi:hypothetical protein